MNDYLKYNEDKTEVIGFYDGLQGDVVIPDGIKKIYNWAFMKCSGITSVFIPDSVIEIGECAFSYRYSLKKIDIPKGVRKISDFAFFSCEDLLSITINNLTYLSFYFYCIFNSYIFSFF